MVSTFILETIGIIGGALCISSFIPQIVKSFKTKKVEDVSIWLVLLTLVGTIFWVAYGLIAESILIILANIIFLVFIIFQLVLMIRYKSK